MREWLLHSEWCDVKLLCRGRVFSAHRAVLASVSPYLRCILISHSDQETPIYIVLPDFDWEAMSSVLYYMYNGEIHLPIGKLSSFFEVINTLKIFVDKSALRNVKHLINDIDIVNCNVDQNEEYHDKKIETLQETDKFVKFVYTLNSNCTKSVDRSQAVTHIQPDRCRQKTLSQTDKKKQHDIDLQRKASLRDPFTEICVQNSNANSPLPDVSAITNERNLQLLSESVVNKNCTVKSTVQDFKTSTIASTNGYHESLSYQMLINYYRLCKSRIEENDLNDYSNIIAQDMNLLSNLLNIENSSQQYNLSTPCKKTNASLTEQTMKFDSNSVDLLDLTKQIQISNIKNIINKIENSHTKERERTAIRTEKYINKNECKKNIRHKISPLNKVLANPWTPCLPRSYQPFHLKKKETTDVEVNQVQKQDIRTSIEELKSSNDNNNNIHEHDTTELDEMPRSTITPEVNCSASCVDEETKISICGESSNEDSSGDSKKQPKSRFKCGECGKTFSQLRNFKYHVSVHRGTLEFAATCSVCGKYFKDRGYLSSHMKIHKNRKEYQCPHCPKSFNQRVAYNMHIRIHAGIKPHVCGDCGKAFSRKMLLKQHQRTHSGERPYACTFCDKRFADRSNMTLHMRLHSGVKPFSCTLCSKSFTKKHHLKTHLNYHTGEKPYSCPRCKMAFSQSSNMRTHLKKCTVEIPTM